MLCVLFSPPDWSGRVFEPPGPVDRDGYAHAVDPGLLLRGQLTLGDVLGASGIIDLADVLAIRHTNRTDGIPEVSHASPAAVIAYTRDQDSRSTVFPEGYGGVKLWLVFMADGTQDGTHRARFYGAYDNHGEALSERTESSRRFRLTPSPTLQALQNRLVVGWTGPRTFHRRGALAGKFRVLEIADPEVIPFPGFDSMLLTYNKLQQVVEDPRYSRWHSALGAVKGIYLITDTSNGRQYVGKADGSGGIFARWSAYATDGHGSNRELVALPKDQCEHFVFSILRVFEPRALQPQVDAAEKHYKLALRSREFGYNVN